MMVSFLNCQIIRVLTIYIDSSEGSKAEEAFSQCKDSEESLDFTSGTKEMKERRALGMKLVAAHLLLDAIAVDRELGLKMLDMYRKEWVAVVEKPRDSDFTSLEEYYQYRMDNFGMR
jgi:hypothetical protein